MFPAAPQSTVTAPDLAAAYRTLRAGCGLIDRSERGKLALSGPEAAAFLNGQVTNDIEALSPGEGCYAAFLTPKGKMLGDLRVLCAPGELLLDTERSALQALFDMIRRFKIGYTVQLHKRTLESALLSLIGPHAREVAAAAAGTEAEAAQLPAETEHAHLESSIGGRPVRLIATAAPAGMDVLCEAADRDAVHAALLAAGAEPVTEAAAEILRVEHGRPRHGVEIDDSVIPQEAGLNERAISFTKGCYVGQETVARLHYRGRPNRHLRGLALAEPLPAGTELRLGEKTVGALGSSVLSPALGPIGLALLRREAEPGATLKAGEQAVPATVVELPFEWAEPPR